MVVALALVVVRSGSDLGSGSSGSSCCCCWQHVRLPPRGVCRFLCWHVLKLEFWHFARPKLNLGFVFASVFAVFSSKKCHNRRAALSKNMLSSPFRIVFFGVFLCVSHFASVFAVFWPSLDFLHMPASTCICLSTLCWGLGGGDDVHAAATCVFFFFC